MQVVSVKDHPNNVPAGWMARINNLRADVDTAIHMNPIGPYKSLLLMNDTLRKTRTDIVGFQKDSMFVPRPLEVTYQATEKLLERVQFGEARLVEQSLYFLVRSFSRKGLNRKNDRLTSRLKELMLEPQTEFNALDGFTSCFPIGMNRLGKERILDTHYCSAGIPFLFSKSHASLKSIFLGTHLHLGTPIFYDKCRLKNPNIAIFGASGGGKSWAQKHIFTQKANHPDHLYVIDKTGEWSNLVRYHGGQVIKIGTKKSINPLEVFPGMNRSMKIISLLSFFHAIVDLSKTQEGVILYALEKAYSVNKGKTPRMRDVIDALKDIAGEDNNDSDERRSARVLARKLRYFTQGAMKRYMDCPTNVDLDNCIISFDISSIPTPLTQAMMLTVLEYINCMRVADLKSRTIFIDEGHFLWGIKRIEKRLIEIFRECRKNNTGVCFSSQHIGDMLKMEDGIIPGEGALANISTVIILVHSSAVISKIAKRFNLNDKELQAISSPTTNILPGQAILIEDNRHTPIRIVTPPEFHDILTTNPEDLTSKGQTKVSREEPGDYKYTTDEKVVYAGELEDDFVQDLLEAGWRKISSAGLNKGGRYDFALNNDSPTESDEHFLLVELIRQEILKFTSPSQCKRFYTKKPDLVFKANGRRIAVEVQKSPIPGKKEAWDVPAIRNKIALLERAKSIDEIWFVPYYYSRDCRKYRRIEIPGKVCRTVGRTNIKKLIRRSFTNDESTIESMTRKAKSVINGDIRLKVNFGKPKKQSK